MTTRNKKQNEKVCDLLYLIYYNFLSWKQAKGYLQIAVRR